jgi:hypothetical protein
MQLNTIKRPGLLLLALTSSVGLAACGSTVAANNFKGEAHNVAQTIANLQNDATTRDQKKVCQNDLASTVVARLNQSGGNCQQALKDQLKEIDNFDLTLEPNSIVVKGATATARIKSTYSGKTHLGTLQLVKEGKSWKVSGVS